MASSKGMQTIDLTKLNLMQLTQFKNQMDQDLQFYQESLQNLKHAQTRLQKSKESITESMTSEKGKEILVPLTGSMYVPGKLSNPDKVIVDIGTGYYVEKNATAAEDYFARKVKFITEQMEKIQMIGTEKNKVREMVIGLMEEKLHQQFAAQQQQK